MSDPTVVLDTTFLISLADKNRPSHSAAVDYYHYFLEHSIEMLLPTVVVAEFCIRQPLDTLPMRNFRVLPFNLADAIQCAEWNASAARAAAGQTGQRDAVKDDFKIMAHAKTERASFLITDDAETLGAYVARLRADNRIDCQVVLLRDGFDPARVNGTGQTELTL